MISSMNTADTIALAGLALTLLGLLCGAIFWMASIAGGIKRMEDKIDSVMDDVQDHKDTIHTITREMNIVALKMENHSARIIELERHHGHGRPGSQHA